MRQLRRAHWLPLSTQLHYNSVAVGPTYALTGEHVKSCVETRDLADSILL